MPQSFIGPKNGTAQFPRGPSTWIRQVMLDRGFVRYGVVLAIPLLWCWTIDPLAERLFTWSNEGHTRADVFAGIEKRIHPR